MTEAKLTDEQRRASRPGAHVWVAASAGTGKTHVLTARVLRLLLEGIDPERLLCVTFTRAAAAEMAGRIRSSLGRWATLDDAALDAAIYRDCGARADAAMRRRARALFPSVLALADGLPIQTIHAFCQSLLGRFPLEAGLSPHFGVIEDVQARELLSSARDRVILEAQGPAAGKLGDALAVIAMEVNEQDFDKLLGALISRRDQLRRLIATYSGIDGVLAAVSRTLGLEPGESEQSIVEDACAAAPVDRLRHLLEPFRSHGGQHEQACAPSLSAFCAVAARERVALWEGYLDIFLRQDREPRSTKSFPTKAVREACPEAFEIVAAEIARIEQVQERLQLARVRRFAEAALRVGVRIVEHYEAEKMREGVLDYDDLIARTRRLLDRSDIAPWILYKLDAGIDHVLVDEAQDTNADQWAIIEALTADFFAGETAREETRTLFAVGDMKQSIFRFQGAEPHEFLSARKRASSRAEAALMEFESIRLDRSFRSSEAVLRLVDAVFEDPAVAEGLMHEEAAITHRAHRSLDAGEVELWPLERAPESPEIEPWSPPLEQVPADTAEARLAVRIAHRIHRMLSGGERLASRDRPIRPGDILVLVRRRTAFMDDLLKRLKALGVPVAGADRMVVSEQLAVQDLMAAAQFALLPEDNLTLAAVLKGPFVRLGEEALFDLAHDRGAASLWEALEARAAAPASPLAPALEFLKELRRVSDQAPPFEFFSHLLTDLGGRCALIERLGGEVADPLDEFLRLAQDFEREHPPSLQGFLHWIGSGRAEIKRDMEQGRNEVRLMTVHGAKGLEAPIIFLPDTNQLPKGGDSLLEIPPAGPNANPDLPLLVWRGNSKTREVGPLAAARDAVDREEDAEYRRLLYVALTRAEERLIVAGWEVRSQGAGRSWYDLVAAGFDRIAEVETITEPGDREIRRYRAPQRGPVRPEYLGEQAPAPAVLPRWALEEPLAEPSPPRPLAPARAGEDEPAMSSPLSGGGPETYRRGRVLHRLLDSLPDLPQGEREAAAMAYLCQPAHGLDAATARAWYAEVAAILEDPMFAPLFAPGSVAEAPISGVVGGRVVSGQIDRLAVGEREVLVVDFKTNRPPPARAEQVPESYLRQMAAYRALLEEAFPGKDIHAALLWTAAPRLMTLPGDLLDSRAPGAASTA